MTDSSEKVAISSNELLNRAKAIVNHGGEIVYPSRAAAQRVRDIIADLVKEIEENNEVTARCYMRLQCADVPREPWHWEVCTTLDSTGIPSTHASYDLVTRLQTELAEANKIIAHQSLSIWKQPTAHETFCDEPKPPEALNAGRYAERLWGYKDQVGSYSEMGRVYEKDRADFWQARFNEATAQKAAAETLRVGASDWEEFGLAVRTVSQNCDMTDLARRGDWLQRELKARGFDIVRSSQKADPQHGAKARDFVEYDSEGGVRIDLARYLRTPAGQAQLRSLGLPNDGSESEPV